MTQRNPVQCCRVRVFKGNPIEIFPGKADRADIQRRRAAHRIRQRHIWVSRNQRLRGIFRFPVASCFEQVQRIADLSFVICPEIIGRGRNCEAKGREGGKN